MVPEVYIRVQGSPGATFAGSSSLGASQQRLIETEAGARRGGTEQDETIARQRELIADLLDHVDQIVLHDQRSDAGILGDVADLASDQSEVDRHRDQARFRSRRVDLGPFDAVIGEHRDAIALVQPKREQAIREPARACIPLPKRERSIEVANPNVVGSKPGVDRQHLSRTAQTAHAPLQARNIGRSQCGSSVPSTIGRSNARTTRPARSPESDPRLTLRTAGPPATAVLPVGAIVAPSIFEFRIRILNSNAGQSSFKGRNDRFRRDSWRPHAHDPRTADPGRTGCRDDHFRDCRWRSALEHAPDSG